MSEVVYQTPRVKGSENETVVTSTCGHNCGGRCVVNAHVVDGRITKISTQSGRWNPHMPPLPACARGIGQVERTYHPDRLLYPMRRTGPRGSGHWEQIDWDEALDEAAAQLVACARRTVTKPSGLITFAAYRCSMAELPPPVL